MWVSELLCLMVNKSSSQTVKIKDFLHKYFLIKQKNTTAHLVSTSSHWTKARLIAFLTHLKAHFIQTQHSQVRCEDILARPTIFFFVCCLRPVPRAMSEHFCRNNSLIGSLIDWPAVQRGERRLSTTLSSIWRNYFCHFSCENLSDVWMHAIICIRDVHLNSFL